jgi:hypothetical protein
MESNNMSGKIRQRIFRQSQPAAAGGAWTFLPPVASLRILPFAEAAGLEELRKEFSADQLEAARVVVRRPDQELELNPVLGGASRRGLFLRPAKAEAPVDIVNQSGSLTTADPPAFGCGRDEFTNHHSQDLQIVLAVCSDDDLVVSRALGLPCTPAAGLDSLNGRQVRQLFGRASGSPSKSNTAPVAAGNGRLLIAAWNIAELTHELPGEVPPIVECLLAVEDAYEVETFRGVGIWRPTESEFDGIRSAARFQDSALARQLIRDSLGRSACSARQFEEEAARRRPVDYPTARRDLLRTLEKAREFGFQHPEVAKKLEEFDRSFSSHVIDAILRDAMKAADSVDRTLLLMAAELMGHWHASTTLVRSTREGISGRGQPRAAALQPSEWQEQLQIVNTAIKIHKTLTSGK